jgi:hypothetical protein
VRHVDQLSRAQLEAVAFALIQERDQRREARRLAEPPKKRVLLPCVHEGEIASQWRSDCQNNVRAFSTRTCNHPDYPGLCRREKAKTIDPGLVAVCARCPLREAGGEQGPPGPSNEVAPARVAAAAAGLDSPP